MRLAEGVHVSVTEDLQSCDEAVERISEFLDGELAPAAAMRLARHVSTCPSCVRAATELAATVALLHGLWRPRLGALAS